MSGCVTHADGQNNATPPNNVDSQNSANNKIIVVDSSNRTVSFDKPVTRVVIENINPTEEIYALGKADSIVGVTERVIKYSEIGRYPASLQNRTVIGKIKEPNYEKIAELQPDVVITFTSMPPLPDEMGKTVEPFNIKVLGLDLYRMEVWEDEIRTLGKILAVEDSVTNDYINFFKDKWTLIKERTDKINKEDRPVVYMEGIPTYLSYGGAGYGCGMPGMIESSGGNYLFPDVEAPSFEADPEEVAKRNPDVIIKNVGGGHNYTDESELKRVWDEVMNRPELQQTNAVKNGRVYVLSQQVCAGSKKKIGPVYISKILYPEMFNDTNPNGFYSDYLENYLDIDYQGYYIYPALE
ncbi:iron complex transport system substrate-binding protein [Methanococcus voltae]|uniref:ABC transporter substrate-binding protein n=1 Tax=Methanococcus voltae TaxID=2188 RepID=UPI001AE9489C|nr:ABC transporter substrate-binding protein [Methanococcus voltae]MBP2143336.1 iron complex transport system substrate-binding protein [Methanococcus voltae]